MPEKKTSPRASLPALAAAFVVGPLLLGALSYFALRAPDVRIHAWASSIGLEPLVTALRAHAPRVPAVIRGTLPDACWAFAFGAALSLVWRGSRSTAWMVGGGIVTAGLELGQAAGVIPGVFDPIDLVAMLAAYFIAWRTCRADISWPLRRGAAPASPR